MGAEPHRTVVVEDSVNGVLAGCALAALTTAFCLGRPVGSRGQAFLARPHHAAIGRVVAKTGWAT